MFETTDASQISGDAQQVIARQQQIRQKQVLTALLVYLSALLPFYYINQLGMLQLTTDMKIFGVIGAVLTNAVFLVVIRSNVNLTFHDPSMTFQQVGAACFWAMLTAWNVAQEARLLAIVLFLLAFLFGVYTLKTRHFLFLSILVLVGYFSMVVREYLRSEAGLAYQVELLHWMVLATGLFWMSLVGGYVSNLRRRLAERKRELTEVAFVDALTGTYNRRYILDVMQREIARIRRGTVETLSVALIDIDLFKNVNDQHGHGAGDTILKNVAMLIKDELRVIDTVGRYGGEEFIVLLPDTNENNATICMERVRKRVERAAAGNIDTAVTVSIGVAEYRDKEKIDETTDRADAAMYAAKQAGRNRVIRHSMVTTKKDKVVPHITPR